ncbi:phage adaptor protein [Allopusillimonas ginsengisoli]|uniref:phage adaptor protein n=1 Tax=Allopusillimonas ginsengisoli TaxID=453575 RepID=UPI001021FD91|nr:hypothetical protein [Allopusillimonas ginsengisoli]TEA78642.1 hypothetical protein ERE07_09605 [Allopusillimonas ginsengisoli]
MSISTYSDLQASVGRWLHRADLASVVADLITFAEARLNRNLRVRQMEQSSSETIVSSEIALPDDWIEFVGAPMLGDTPLDFVTRDQYKARRGCYGNYYTIMGSTLLIGAQIHDSAQLSFDYYAKIPALSDFVESNWLLADGPDIYLYGALLEAEPYLKNDARIETWRGLLQVALTDIQAASDRAKYSGGTLIMRRA